MWVDEVVLILVKDAVSRRPTGICGRLPFATPCLDVICQVAQIAVLHDKIDVAGRFETIEEFNDVGMANLLEDRDLALEIFEQLGREFFPRHDFDSYPTGQCRLLPSSLSAMVSVLGATIAIINVIGTKTTLKDDCE